MIDKTPLPQEIESTQTDVAGGPQSAVDLGLDHTIRDFSDTSLKEADEHGLITEVPHDVVSGLEAAAVPPSDEQLPTVDEYNRDRAPKRRKGAAIIGSAVALATLAAGAVGIGLKGGGSAEERRSDTAAGAVANDPEATSNTTIPEQQVVETQINDLPAPTTPTAESTAASPESINASGNIDITRILPGEKFMTIQRNGKDIRIPHLTDPQKDPNRFAETFLAQFAAYMTTGNQEILAAMTESEEVAAKMKAMRDEDMVPRQATNPMSQMSFKDFRSDPATFALTPDKNGVVLEEGTVEFGEVPYDPDWQDLVHYSKPGDLGNAFKTMRITVQYVKDSDGSFRTTVSGYSWTAQ